MGELPNAPVPGSNTRHRLYTLYMQMDVCTGVSVCVGVVAVYTGFFRGNENWEDTNVESEIVADRFLCRNYREAVCVCVCARCVSYSPFGPHLLQICIFQCQFSMSRDCSQPCKRQPPSYRNPLWASDNCKVSTIPRPTRKNERR